MKFLSGTQCTITTETQVSLLVTRTKLLSTVSGFEASAKSATDQELQNLVGNNVVQHFIESDKIEAHSY